MPPPNLFPPAANKAIPKDVLQTLTIIALQQPIPLLTLVSHRGPVAFEHVHFLEVGGLVRTEGKGETQTVITTALFADTFGLNRDVKKIQAELRMDLNKLH